MISGFPGLSPVASGVDRLPRISQGMFVPGPPASSGFPSPFGRASGMDRLPCIHRQRQGLPHGRASHLISTWPLAESSLQVAGHVFHHRASREFGLPLTAAPASGVDRLPGVCRFHCWASSGVGFPIHIHDGLRRRPASRYIRAHIAPGLPPRRASFLCASRPPALTGFH